MIKGLLVVIASSPWMRTARRYGATVLVILLFLLARRRSGERAGRPAEQLATMEKAHYVQRRMLEAAVRRRSSRGDLTDRLRDGRM